MELDRIKLVGIGGIKIGWNCGIIKFKRIVRYSRIRWGRNRIKWSSNRVNWVIGWSSNWIGLGRCNSNGMSRMNSGNKFVRMLKKGEDKLVKFKYGWDRDFGILILVRLFVDLVIEYDRWEDKIEKIV